MLLGCWGPSYLCSQRQSASSRNRILYLHLHQHLRHHIPRALGGMVAK